MKFVVTKKEEEEKEDEVNEKKYNTEKENTIREHTEEEKLLYESKSYMSIKMFWQGGIRGSNVPWNAYDWYIIGMISPKRKIYK